MSLRKQAHIATIAFYRMVLTGPKFLVPDDLSIARSSIIAAF